jgi:glycosyltransferase involved in cell wall biosynthesis
MESRRPTISIVMRNYNHASELRRSLPAIVNQSRPADEVIIVNDGSTDDSLAVIGEFASLTTTLRLVRNEVRQGVVAAVNRGLREAICDYVILAAADEQIVPDMCEQMETALIAFPHSQLVVAKFTEWFPETGITRHGQDDECDFWFVRGLQPIWVSPALLRDLLWRRHVRLSVNSAMFKRTALFEVGLFDPALEWHSDWFAIYATAFRHGFTAVPRVLSWYRVARESYSSNAGSNSKGQRRVVRNLHEKLDTAAFADVRRALMRAPSSMSPMMRATLLVLIARPSRYGRLAYIAAWWLREVVRGHRPRIWATAVKSLRRRLFARAAAPSTTTAIGYEP